MIASINMLSLAFRDHLDFYQRLGQARFSFEYPRDYGVVDIVNELGIPDITLATSSKLTCPHK
jgi:hypothetical protein